MESKTTLFRDDVVVTFANNEKIKQQCQLGGGTGKSMKNYEKLVLNSKLFNEDWLFGADLVQDYWNILEYTLICIFDEIIPYAILVNNINQSVKLHTQQVK
jgi:hypothetical protein